MARQLRRRGASAFWSASADNSAHSPKPGLYVGVQAPKFSEPFARSDGSDHLRGAIRDATAAAKLPEGDSYLAAIINFRYMANAVWSTDEAIKYMTA